MGILLTIGQAILSFFVPYALCFGIGWYCCNQYHAKHDSRHGADVVRRISETAIEVQSGASLTVSAGLFHRKTRNVTLYGLELPANISDAAKLNLSNLIKPDDDIEVIIESGKKIGDSDIVGTVFGKSGVNCNLEQLRNGLAKTSVLDKAFVSAQDEAKRAKVGIWKVKDEDNKKPHRWWADETIKGDVQ